MADDPREGRRIADALGGHKAVLLRNHGLLTAAGWVDAAAYWFVTRERSAQAQPAAQASGPTVPIPHEEARRTYGQVGFDLAGWFQFQPLFDQVSRTDPDLFG